MSEQVAQSPAPSPAPSARRRWPVVVGPVAWVLAVVVVGFTSGPYYSGIGATVGLTALLALGLILVTGYAGQFSLAVGAFYGIGAYGSALLASELGWPGLLVIVLGAAVAGLVAYLLGRPIFRLRGHFLAMGTLALTEVFYLLVNNLTVTGGSSGLPVNPLQFGDFSLIDTAHHFIVNWLVVGLVLWGALRLAVGREGRALKAIRGHEAAAASAGINIASSKTRVFTASAVISSVAGSLYAHELMYVNPPPFSATTAIDVLVVAVLGGMRSPWGAVIGAIVMEALHEGINALLPRLLGQGAVGAGETLILGLLLVVILVARPDGIVGAAQALIRRIRRPAAAPAAIEREQPSGTMAGWRSRDDRALAEEGHRVGAAVLTADGLVKNFGGVVAVNDVSLQIRSGEVLAVIGPNGAGKSTLVNLLSGNLRPTSGSVQLDQQAVTGWPAHQVAAKGLARTFQTPCLFDDMDVTATVAVGAHLRGRAGMLQSALPTPGAVREERRLNAEALATLQRLGLDHLGRLDAKTLSLGQQKQIEIARALVAEPRVLLLDEPCAGLNKSEKFALMTLLRQLVREDLAILVIEHDMEFVMSAADRVHVLNFGSTLREGTPAQVQADPEVIRAYLGTEEEVQP